ncbi:MAG: aldose 1-epimerase family protein [Microbacterium sp.]|uniref:aldose 1-epimerase family protein n=1 Tax=Microbacterium sp. TaxID=51671 RepID=UPI0039E5CC3E
MTRELYGMPLADARARLGGLEPVASIEASTAAGSRRIRVVNGPLDVDLLPDRGLDVAQVRAHGVPIAWTSATGFPPLNADAADGRGWARAFGGGLVTTCGLLNYGPQAVDGGIAHPMHGRYSSLSARVVRADVVDDEVVVEGVVREASLFGSDLELRRRITSPIGQTRLRIADVVVNRGNDAVEPMVLYHVNFGWPLVDEGTRLVSPALAVEPRDAAAAAGRARWDTFPAPAHPYPEQVFAHALPAGGEAEVVVDNPRGLSARVRFDASALRGLFQWRVAEPGCHVLGIEPATAPTILGRADARERGLLRALEPGAALELGVELELAGSL